MDFLLVYSPAPEIGRYPFFGSTVAEAAAGAAATLDAGELLVLADPGGDTSALEAAGARRVTLGEAVTLLQAAERGKRCVLLAPGIVSNLGPELASLVEAAGPAPLRLENADGQTLAVAGTTGALAPAVRPGFRESLDVLGPVSSVGAAEGHTRIEDAATWSAAIRESQRLTARRFLASGVLVEDPDTLWADPSCRAEPGARIGAAVRLAGSTSIAAGAEVGSFCRLENTEIGPGARILSHSVLLDSSIGREAKVGPFAHIRPNTRLEPESFAGSFVETKNAVLARRAALPHLSYVGDADIGVRANLGAGTVTCNYDGRGKHRTVVEPGAFVGSNAILVAPVTIGRRAFVAAGSVIVEDVPEGALAIARGRQAVKLGRAEGRFEGADEV